MPGSAGQTPKLRRNAEHKLTQRQERPSIVCVLRTGRSRTRKAGGVLRPQKSTYLPGCWQAIVMACNPTCTDLQIPNTSPAEGRVPGVRNPDGTRSPMVPGGSAVHRQPGTRHERSQVHIHTPHWLPHNKTTAWAPKEPRQLVGGRREAIRDERQLGKGGGTSSGGTLPLK
jgi:hypothetical protein